MGIRGHYKTGVLGLGLMKYLHLRLCNYTFFWCLLVFSLLETGFLTLPVLLDTQRYRSPITVAVWWIVKSFSYDLSVSLPIAQFADTFLCFSVCRFELNRPLCILDLGFPRTKEF